MRNTKISRTPARLKHGVVIVFAPGWCKKTNFLLKLVPETNPKTEPHQTKVLYGKRAELVHIDTDPSPADFREGQFDELDQKDRHFIGKYEWKVAGIAWVNGSHLALLVQPAAGPRSIPRGATEDIIVASWSYDLDFNDRRVTSVELLKEEAERARERHEAAKTTGPEEDVRAANAYHAEHGSAGEAPMTKAPDIPQRMA